MNELVRRLWAKALGRCWVCRGRRGQHKFSCPGRDGHGVTIPMREVPGE